MPDPATVSVADALGLGLTAEHKGKTYDLAPVDHPEVIGRYQDHLRTRALHEVDATRRLLGPLAGDLAMKAYLDNATAGAYDFGSEFWLETIKHPTHQKAVLFFSLRAKDRSVSQALAAEVYRDCPEAVVRLIYGDPSRDAGADEAPGPNA